MKPHHANAAFTGEELDLFERIRASISGVHDLYPSDLSCHELARAAGAAFNLPFADGRWLLMFDHSWLYIPGRGHVIDVFPIGHAGRTIRPIMVDAHIATQWIRDGRRLYDTSRPPKFEIRAHLVTLLMQEIIREDKVHSAIQLKQQILDNASTIPEGDYSAFLNGMLKYNPELSVADLATRLGKTEAWVRKQLKRG